MTRNNDVVAAAGEFAATYLQANAAQWERDRYMPREMFLHAADAGLCGLLVAEELGGQNVDFTTLIQVVEKLAYTDFAAAFALVVHNNHARAISTQGTNAQIARWLPDMLAGRTVGAFLLTEPGGGSDAAHITTAAVADGDDYVLNGDKAWVTNSTHADLLNVFAQTQPGGGAKGIASFQVPADSAGVQRLDAYDMLGSYAMSAGGFRFENVRVAADQLLVPPGQGFKAALAGIDIARTVVAGMCCGMLQSGLDVVIPRLLERHAFGGPLIDQQGLAWQIADVATDLAATRLLAAEAARLIDANKPAALTAAHAKKFATSVTLNDIAACMQAMGADGLKQQYPLARHLAAAKIAQYIDGTTEIQNVVISRALQEQYKDLD
jgi:alkylation response protein AidB-like acyl-CoA dehydrogenase